jgi:hypothetical protein
MYAAVRDATRHTAMCEAATQRAAQTETADRRSNSRQVTDAIGKFPDDNCGDRAVSTSGSEESFGCRRR